MRIGSVIAHAARAAGLALLLSGCGFGGGPSTVFLLERVTIVATEDANAQSATAVDLVFVYDETAVPILQNLTASDWFARRAQIRRDFPEGVGVKSWEIVPKSVVSNWEVPEEMLENASGDDAVAGFLFASYFSPGDHRARLESRRALRIELERDDFVIGAPDTGL